MKRLKFFSFLLVFIILLTSSLSTPTKVLAIYSKPTISVDSAECHSGDEIDIIVTVSNNPGICSIRLEIGYDSNLTLTSVKNGELMSDNVFGKQLTANPYCVTWDESLADNNNTENGTLVTLTFKISESTQAGDYPIYLSYRPGDIFNLDLTDIDFDLVNGKVTVKTADIPVKIINLDKTEISINKGNAFQLTAVVLPDNATDKTVIWESNNKNIATVDDNGVVTGIKSGTTKIVAKSKDGTVQATCNVTINCIHDSKSTYTEKESTCVEQGNDSYYVCDDCGKIFDADGVTELEVPPFRPFGNHTGGTATCQVLAVCSVCGHTYGDYVAHNYTAQAKSKETLKSAGTCSEKAVYYYSCAVCGACERNETHIFYGDKDATNHKGQTEFRNNKEATCCENGYTGDTYCKDCNNKIASGSVIHATGNHVDTDGKWETDEIQHWYTCYYGTHFETHPHIASDWIVDIEPTINSNGAKYKKCTVCGKILETEIIPDTHIPGDVNYDGKVNNKDLTRLFQYLSKWDVRVNTVALDINGDRKVNNKDLTRLFQYLSNWDVKIY